MSLFLGIAYIIRGPGEHRRALCIGKRGWHSVPGECGDCNLHGSLFYLLGEVEDFGLSCMKPKDRRDSPAIPFPVCIHMAHAMQWNLPLSLLWPDSVISSGCYGQ